MNDSPTIVEVRTDPNRVDRGWITVAHHIFPCTLGRSGIAVSKVEGDGRTPAGVFPLRRALYRTDRGPKPATGLPTDEIARDDGWCDDPKDAAYNRKVRLPYAARAENLWRDDGAYDVIVVIGHNDDPPVAGAGSAIFLHLAHDDGRPTAGCVAVSRATMAHILASVGPGSVIVIQPPAA